MEIDKKMVLNNIYALAKAQGKNIGDLEKACGASVGYLSRLRSDDNKSLPGIEFLATAASMLDVSLNLMITTDLAGADSATQYMVGFLARIEKETDEDVVMWREVSENSMGSIRYGEFGDYGHPLYRIEGPDAYFNSQFHGDRPYRVMPKSYQAHLGSVGRNLYVLSTAPVATGDMPLVEALPSLTSTMTGAGTDIEVYFVTERDYGPDGVAKVCHMQGSADSVLDAALLSLQRSIAQSLKRLHIEPDAKSIIDSYMAPSVEEELPF